eukprot:c12301_g1_i1.p1 GENE.c12301_g1_i1~~c12301_g1_i1.p1  ORF type:complete len:268 (-),score=38.90 c12301_g1_i1:193-996(-)
MHTRRKTCALSLVSAVRSNCDTCKQNLLPLAFQEIKRSHRSFFEQEKCNEPAPKCSAVSHFSASMKHNSVSLTSLSSLDSPKFAPVLQSPSSVHPALTLPSKCVSLPRVVSSAAPAPISNPPRNDMWDLMKNCRRLLKTREGFDLCVFFVRNNESKCFMDTLGDADKLALYGAYKQAVFGPCTTPMPAGSEVVARAKWSSWTQLRDVSCDDARRLYIQLLRRMRRVWIAECSALDRSSNSRMSPPVDDNLRKKQARLMYLSFLDYIE